MGSISSKPHSVPSTPIKSLGPIALTRSEGIADLPLIDQIDPLLDPRSPNIERTPISTVLSIQQRLKNSVATTTMDDAQTPNNFMQRKLLRDLGYNYSVKELNMLDPRSPSLFIPRTPLDFKKVQDDGAVAADLTNSFEYNECIEEASCRNFNEKISNITLDDSNEELPADGAEDVSEIRRKYLETNFDVVEPKSKSEENDDPRSPSLNVYRTPIVLSGVPKGTIPKQISPDNMENFLLDINEINEPVFSSTPTTTIASTETPTKRTCAIAKKQKNLVYEDEIDGDIIVCADTIKTKSQDDIILMTPMQKFNQKDGDGRVRTPLSVVNRRSKSAENLITSKQLRFRAMGENNQLNQKYKINEDENTPKSSMIPMRMPLSNRNSVSKIPIIKRREY